MLKIVLGISALLALGFFWLPLAVGLSLERLSPDRWRLRLNSAFFRGLVGFSLDYQPPSWHLYPLILGRPLGFLPLRSGPKQRASPAPASGAPVPTGADRPTRSPTVRPADLARWLLRPGIDLFAALPRAARLKKVRVRGCFGFEDPAMTGSAFGYLQGLGWCRSRRLELELFPDFTRPGFRGSLDLVVHLHLGLLLFLALRFTLQAVCRWAAGRLPWSSWKPGFV
jgi:hypothetical protein